MTLITRLAAFLALTGCYELPPPKVPRPELPPIVAGATLEVDARDTTERRPVTSRERVCVGSDCSTVSVTSNERVNVHRASATYNGSPVTLGQAQALGDPTYLRDLQRMQDLTGTCDHAKVPKYLGEALFTVGTLLIINGAGTSDGSIKEPYFGLGIAGMAGGIVSYALGKYVFGGQACDEALSIYQARRAEWQSQGDRDVEGSLANELETVANTFNQHAHPTASAASE